VTNSPSRTWIIWVVTTVTTLTTIYEATALLTGATTISTALRTLAENYHPVYTFAGILCGFLFIASLTGWHFPLLVRAAILGWIFVFGHIFWGFC
jgi:hypothetical protein